MARRLVVGVVPVSDRLDLKALARALAGRKAAMAEVAAADLVAITGAVVDRVGRG